MRDSEGSSMGDAFLALPLAALLATSSYVLGQTSSPAPATAPLVPAPAPEATANAGPLKEIGHVHATTPYCKAVLTQALAGITAVVENDARIADAEKSMRRIDADPNPIVRFSRWQGLNEQYAALRTAAVAGRAAIRRMRNEAADAPTTTQKKALLELARAVDGALARQNKIGDVVGRLAQYVDNHQPADETTVARDDFENSITPPNAQARQLLRVKRSVSTPPLADVAKRDADDVAERTGPLARDEDDAASKIDAAFNNC